MKTIKSAFMSTIRLQAILYTNEITIDETENMAFMHVQFTVPDDIADRLGVERFKIVCGSIGVRRQQ